MVDLFFTSGSFRVNWNPNPEYKNLATDEIHYKEVVIGMIAASVLAALTGYLVIVLAIV